MITKKDAILLAQTIARAAKREIDQYCAVRYDGEKVPAIRGAIFRSLDDIWYDVLPVGMLEKFAVPGSAKSPREHFLDIAREILDK